MISRSILIVLTTALLFGDARGNDDVAAWITANVPGMMRDAQMPGFAIAVVQDGETIYAQAFGARDLERGLPATTDTLFGIGSITKSFVAIAILQLAEQGKLSLDDPVSKYIPFELGRTRSTIRIRHFLSHSPGFPNLATSSILIGQGLGEGTAVPMSSAEDFFRFINGAKDEVIFEPGEHFFYNNAAWRMLGAIIQEASGMPFHEYVTNNVIRPLGMERTTFDTDDLFADADHLTPYQQSAEGPKPADFPYPNPATNPGFSFLSAAGGIASSVTEMTRYLNALINMGEHENGRLVDSRAMSEMQSLQIREPDGYYGETGYGFGLGVIPNFLGETLIEHGGSIVVSTANMRIIPERKIGVIMMGNAGGMPYATIGDSVLAILMNRTPAEVVPALGVRERMQNLVGSYATYENVETLDVVEERGMLYLRTGDALSPLIPESTSYDGSNFYLLSRGVKTPVEVRVGRDGSVTMLIARYVYRKTS